MYCQIYNLILGSKSHTYDKNFLIFGANIFIFDQNIHISLGAKIQILYLCKLNFWTKSRIVGLGNFP